MSARTICTLLEQIVRTRQRHPCISSAITRNCLTVILKTLGNHTKTLGNAHNARQPSKMLDDYSKLLGGYSQNARQLLETAGQSDGCSAITRKRLETLKTRDSHPKCLTVTQNLLAIT